MKFLSEPRHVIGDPPIAITLFSETGWWSAVWAVLRVWLGWQWLQAGWHKVGDPLWQNGAAMQKFLEKAVLVPAPPLRPAVTYGWYRDFLQFLLDSDLTTPFGYLISWGELLVGLGLVLGAFVGVAAFFGAFMNFNFLLAGTVSTNPMFFLAAITLILAWKTAGHWGADRWLLPRLGTPWRVTVTNTPPVPGIRR